MGLKILSKIRRVERAILTKRVVGLYVNGRSYFYTKVLSRNPNNIEYLQVLNELTSVIQSPEIE